MSVQSVPVHMATSAMSRRHLCKWLQLGLSCLFSSSLLVSEEKTAVTKYSRAKVLCHLSNDPLIIEPGLQVNVGVKGVHQLKVNTQKIYDSHILKKLTVMLYIF